MLAFRYAKGRQRSWKALSLTEKVSIPDLEMGGRGEHMLRMLRLVVRINLSTKLKGGKKEICANFAPQAVNIRATVSNKCLVKMERHCICEWKAWTESMFWFMVVLNWRTLNLLQENFSKESPSTNDIKHFYCKEAMATQIQEQVWTENIKIIGEAASANKEAVATFSANDNTQAITAVFIFHALFQLSPIHA